MILVICEGYELDLGLLMFDWVRFRFSFIDKLFLKTSKKLIILN